MANEIVKFERGGEVVQFTADEVRRTLCPQATDKELAFRRSTSTRSRRTSTS